MGVESRNVIADLQNHDNVEFGNEIFVSFRVFSYDSMLIISYLTGSFLRPNFVAAKLLA